MRARVMTALVMWGVLAQPASAARCDKFVAQLQTPMRISERQLSARDLGVDALASTGVTSVGDLAYRGYGWVTKSRDPRFRDVVTRGQYPHHLCGYEVTSNSGSVDAYLASFNPMLTQVYFATKPGVRAAAPGAGLSLPDGASLPVKNTRVVATWRVGNGKGWYYGLLHPKSGESRTLLVEFGTPESGIKPRVLATLPLFLDTIEVLPDLHSSREFFNLRGKDVGGSLTFVQLSLGGPLVLPWDPKGR